MGNSSAEAVYRELLKQQTIRLVIDHELPGVTPGMLDWWWDHMDNETYRLWHPEDHIALEWQVSPEEVGHIGAIHMACEKISAVPAHILRIRWEDPVAAPIPTRYGHVNVGSPLAPGREDVPMSCVVHEYEATAYGTRLRSTFLLPAAVPQPFIDSLRRHNMAEMARFPAFLPDLFDRKAGN